MKKRIISTEYKSWGQMKVRCNCKTNQNYWRYGGRGIKVCERWNESFANFLDDMGYKPTTKHTLERIDNDGNYEPANCVWATMTEQVNNRSSCRIYEYNGEKYNRTQLAKRYNMNPWTLKRRLDSGWTVKDSIEKPISSHNTKNPKSTPKNEVEIFRYSKQINKQF